MKRTFAFGRFKVSVEELLRPSRSKRSSMVSLFERRSKSSVTEQNGMLSERRASSGRRKYSQPKMNNRFKAYSDIELSSLPSPQYRFRKVSSQRKVSLISRGSLGSSKSRNLSEIPETPLSHTTGSGIADALPVFRVGDDSSDLSAVSAHLEDKTSAHIPQSYSTTASVSDFCCVTHGHYQATETCGYADFSPAQFIHKEDDQDAESVYFDTARKGRDSALMLSEDNEVSPISDKNHDSDQTLLMQRSNNTSADRKMSIVSSTSYFQQDSDGDSYHSNDDNLILEE